MWNGSAVVVTAAANWPAGAVPLVRDAGTNDWFGDAPSALPAGSYTRAYQQRAGSQPAGTDLGLAIDPAPLAWAGSPVAPTPPVAPSVLLRVVYRDDATGSPVDPSPAVVTLGGPGVVRADTGEVVVPAGTPMPRAAAGTYAYELSPAVAGATYLYYPSSAFDGPDGPGEQGVTVPPAQPTEPPAPPAPAGYYATLADLYAEFSPNVVAEWSNLDGSGGANDPMPSVDYARVQRALVKADDWVNARLRGGRYALPLSGPLAMSMANVWAARYAGRYLAQARGAGDKKSPGYTKYDAMIDECLREMAAVRAGTIRLDAPDRWPMPSAPVSGAFGAW